MMGVEPIVGDHERNALASVFCSKPYIIDLIVVEVFATWKVVELN